MKYLSVAECATACREASSIFIFARADDYRCEADGCYCYCELTADDPSGCIQVDNARYDLYQFTTKFSGQAKHSNVNCKYVNLDNLCTI